MIIFPKEMKFLYDHHRKGDEPWRKIPTGICKARRHYIDSKEFRHLPPATRQDNDRYRRTYSENSVPCHHPQQKGALLHWSSSCRRRKSKNPPFWIEKGWIMHVKGLAVKHTFLSLVGQTVVQNRQFSWLCFLAPPAFPISSNQWLRWIHSALQWRDRAGLSPVFPIKPYRAPVFLWSYSSTEIPIKKPLCTNAKRHL